MTRKIIRGRRSHALARHSPDAEIISAREACELLGVNRKTLYDACGRGEVPHGRVGGRLVFSRTALIQHAAGRKIA